MSIKLVKKITVKNVLGKKPSAALLGEAETVDLMTVYGTANKAEEGTHDFGDGNVSEFIKFRGNFGAVRVADGTEFRSGVMILPDVAGNVLGPVVSDLGEGAKAVEFGFLITIKKAETTIGYEYLAEPLTKPADHDPLDSIKAQLAGAPGIPALEAPPAAETAPAKKKARASK